MDNLELFLNDIYENECLIKAPQDEIDFIQTGIETLVQNSVRLILENLTETFPRRFEWLISHESLIGLEKLYVHPPKDSAFLNDWLRYAGLQHAMDKCANTTKDDIIKVGSFYEGTKNKFPDEFDFIFPLFCLKHWHESRSFKADNERILEWICPHLLEVDCIDKNKESLRYCSPNSSPYSEIEIIFDKIEQIHGPAIKFRFIYQNGIGERKYIRVDISPAFTVLIDDEFKEYVKKTVKPESFRREVLKADKYLLVSPIRSVTETEIHFMRNILSEKHLKVYRILKFLINGHGDGDILNMVNNTTVIFIGYSSYQIKTMMIYHHDECENPETDNIGGCVIQIMERICEYSKQVPFPCLFESQPFENGRWEILAFLKKQYNYIVKSLESMTEKLQIMQFSEERYDYEYKKMESAAKQCLDSLDRGDQELSSWFKYIDALKGESPNYDSFLKLVKPLKTQSGYLIRV